MPLQHPLLAGCQPSVSQGGGVGGGVVYATGEKKRRGGEEGFVQL